MTLHGGEPADTVGEAALPPAPSLRRQRARLPFYAVTPFTLQDFPGRSACILWLAGCNMRCGYCHNPQIVDSQGRGDPQLVMDFLERRKGLLDGVVLSGGEATSWAGLPDFCVRIRALGFAIKLDTNGLRPDVVAHLLGAGLIDMVALDYKAPPEKFRLVTGTTVYDRFSATLDLLCAQDRVPFEVRTTVHTDLLDERDIIAMARDLAERGFAGRYAVQNYIHANDRPTLGNLPPPSRPLDLGQLQGITVPELEFRNFAPPPVSGRKPSSLT